VEGILETNILREIELYKCWVPKNQMAQGISYPGLEHREFVSTSRSLAMGRPEYRERSLGTLDLEGQSKIARRVQKKVKTTLPSSNEQGMLQVQGTFVCISGISGYECLLARLFELSNGTRSHAEVLLRHLPICFHR